jgi:hypothetical protein
MRIKAFPMVGAILLCSCGPMAQLKSDKHSNSNSSSQHPKLKPGKSQNNQREFTDIIHPPESSAESPDADIKPNIDDESHAKTPEQPPAQCIVDPSFRTAC